MMGSITDRISDLEKWGELPLDRNYEDQTKDYKKIIPKILNICMIKGLDFQVSPELKLVQIYEPKEKILITSYYEGYLIDYTSESGSNITIPAMLEFLKQYKTF